MHTLPWPASYVQVAAFADLAYNQPMQTMLDMLMELFRTAPWLVWVMALPVVVVLRNRGLAWVDANHRESRAHRTLWLLLATLAACTAVFSLATITYQILSA